MQRNIYTVSAWIVDANGTKNNLTGYPQDFDSKNYNGDADKALRRAEGEMSTVWGAMCKRDDRLIQTVTLTNVYGAQLDCKRVGMFPDEPEEVVPPDIPPEEGE